MTLTVNRYLGLTIALTVLAASTPTSQATSPEQDMPERWLYTPQQSQTLPPDDDWWRGFNDPLLDSLISEAVNNNYNVAIAASRIRAAEAAISSAKAGYYPTVGLSAGYTLARQSGNLTKEAGEAVKSHYMSLGANASWEIDLFGRIAASVREQKELKNVARADYDGTMVSLCASLATAYISLRAAQTQEQVAQAHLKTQKRVLEITEERHEAALVSGLDVAQAKTVYGSTKAILPDIRSSIASSINAIALLLGRFPAEVSEMLSRPATMPAYDGLVATSIPAELLRRRPDIIAAERTIAARAAALGVAKKDFLPTLAIQGSFGVESRDADRLFKNQSITYSVAPTLTWTVFDGFGRRAAVESARVENEIAVETYNQTVLSATTEVENALSAYINARDYVTDLADVVASAKQEVALSLEQYKTGLTLFTPVAQALMTFLQYDDELVSARASEAKALIDLYRALGGGYGSPTASQSNKN